MILKKGIDKLLNDKFYREMYENYKDLNNKPQNSLLPGMKQVQNSGKKSIKKSYPNELTRILDDD